MTGNRWKTTGGSLGFLSSICCKTLRTTATRRKEANPRPIMVGYDDCAVNSPNGPDISARTPIVSAATSEEQRAT